MPANKTNTRRSANASPQHPAWTHRLRLGRTIGSKPPMGFGMENACLGNEESGNMIHAPEKEGHLLTLGATGSGKSRSVIIPQVLSYQGSMVIIDCKAEIYHVTARARREMGQEVIALDPFGLLGEEPADGFNPFDVRRITGEGIESFALEIPEWMCGPYGPSMKSDAFWDVKGNGLISGVTAAVLGTELPENQNVVQLRDMLHAEDTIYSLAVLMDNKQKQLSPLARQQIGAFLSTEDKCRSGVLATAQERFTNFYHTGVEHSLRNTTFDLEGFRDGKSTTIYVILPPQKLEAYGRLLRLWLAGLLSLLFTRREQPALSTLFVLDEAAALGPLSQLKTLLTLMRSYGVRAWILYQDASQITSAYEKYWPTILNNVAALQILSANTHLAAKGIAELTGDCLSPQQILELPTNEQLILTQGGKLQRLIKLDYLVDPLFKGSFDPNPMYASCAPMAKTKGKPNTFDR